MKNISLLFLILPMFLISSCINTYDFKLSVGDVPLPSEAVILENPETGIITAHYYTTFKEVKDCKDCKPYLVIENHTSENLQNIITNKTKKINLILIIKNPNNKEIEIFKQINKNKKIKLHKINKSKILKISIPTNKGSNKVNIIINNNDMLLTFVNTTYKIRR